MNWIQLAWGWLSLAFFLIAIAKKAFEPKCTREEAENLIYRS